MSATSGPQPEEMFEMIVDRPFVFTIDDKESGETLFIGAIINPYNSRFNIFKQLW